ncbi:MAG TPA: histidine kinase [Terriglobales bacterium]
MERTFKPDGLRWMIIWMGWTAVATLFAVRTMILLRVRGAGLPPVPMVTIEFVYWYVWAAFTPFVIWLVIRFPLVGGRKVRHTVYHLIFAMLVAPLHAATENYVCVGLLRTVFRENNAEVLKTIPPLPVSILFYSFNGIVIYWVIVGLYQGIHFYRAAMEKETKAAQLQAQLVNSELENLKSQLHPHFLFNSLNTIGMLMRENVEAASDLLVSLGDLLRMALDRRSHETTLQCEVEFVRKYLEIEQARFNDRLRVRIDIDEGLQSACVPSLIVQPLVENSIKHGISAYSSAGSVEISAKVVDGRLQISVQDDGPGKNGDSVPTVGIGLKNVTSRLKQLYGNDASFALTDVPGGGCEATITLPLRLEAGSR